MRLCVCASVSECVCVCLCVFKRLFLSCSGLSPGCIYDDKHVSSHFADRMRHDRTLRCVSPLSDNSHMLV